VNKHQTLAGRFVAALTEDGARDLDSESAAIAQRLVRQMAYEGKRYRKFAYEFLMRLGAEERRMRVFRTRHRAHAVLRSLAAGKRLESKDIALAIVYAELWGEFLSTLGSKKPLAA
jgi:hypothetical protein